MDPGTLRRLAFAKTLYRLGDALLQPAISIQNAQGIVIMDAVAEALLRIAVASKGQAIKDRRRTFHDIVTEAQQSGVFGDKSPNYNQLEEIHHVRNQIQHHGIFPDASHVALLTEYARSNFPLIVASAFNLNWNLISVAELFKDKLTRDLFKAGESAWTASQFADASVYLVASFERERITEQTRMFGSLITYKREEANLSAIVQDVKLRPIVDFVTSLHDDVEIVKLRLDYKAYMKYRDLAITVLSPWLDWTPFMAESSSEVFENTKNLLSNRSRLWDTDYLKSEWLPFAFPFVEDSILMWGSVERAGWVDLLLKALSESGQAQGAR